MGTERFVDFIQKKKNGETLTKEEIDFMITDYVAGKIPDHQHGRHLIIRNAVGRVFRNHIPDFFLRQLMPVSLLHNQIIHSHAVTLPYSFSLSVHTSFVLNSNFAIARSH